MKNKFVDQNYQYTGLIASISVLSIVVGLLVLIGYKFHIIAFISITPFWLNMKVNTAICFILSGLALWSLRYIYTSNARMLFVYLCGLIIMLIGFLTLVEYIFRISLGIDTIFYQSPLTLDDILFPRKTSVATATCLLLLGLAFLTINLKYYQHLIFQCCIAIVLSIAFFSLLGYFYNINTVHIFTYFTKMAIHTSIMLIFLSAGILLSRPHVGIMGLILSNTLGGKSARMLLPNMFIIPLFIGFLENVGEKLNIWGPDFGDNLQVALTIIGLFIVIILHSYFLNRETLQKK